MGKKRIYEVAKELGIDSKELVKKLLDIGVEVKSHSSTVDEDDIKRALAKPAPKKIEGLKRPGMVVRKKADIVAEAATIAESAPEDEQQQPGESRMEPELTASSQSLQEQTEEELLPEDRQVEAAAEEVAPAVEIKGGEPHAGAPVTGEPAVPAMIGGPTKPTGPGGARVVRMIDREKLISRIPPRRGPGTGPRPGGLPGARPMGGPSRPGGAPRFSPGTRPGPGSLEPQMPGHLRFGPVKELRVVSDVYGKGKEMIDVAKEKAGKKTGARAGDDQKRPKLDKRSLMQMHERNFSQSRLKRRRGLKRVSTAPTSIMKASKRVIHMDETMTPADLAKELSVKVTDIVRKLMELGITATVNQPLDFDTVTLIAQGYEFTVTSEAYDETDYIEEEAEAAEGLPIRPPVVTVMGHVDHGKTSLLDAIRSANVAEGEAGGITQHIGAYQVDTPSGKITFLDTPGHEAFTAMRARGASVTDLVVLVVAADDGPMPQTVEAIRHAQAAEVPIIVAINKIDKPGAKPEQIMQALTEYKLVPEEWGGDTIYVKTSALKKTGIKELLETIALQAEVLELRADPERYGKGSVIEARLDKGFGPRATIIVQDGTVHVGDPFVAGDYSGKVRSITDSKGQPLKEAGPSTPIEITGMDGVPSAGDQMNCTETIDDAKEVAAHRTEQARDKDLKARTPKISLEDLYAKLKGASAGAPKELKVIIKADVQGSVEALREAFVKLSTPEVTLTVIHGAVGAVNEGDIMLASASNAIVVCFNVRPDSKSKQLAETEGIEIKTYNIIYNALDDIKKAMGGLLAPTQKEKILGRAEVRQVFNAPKIGIVAGCAVTEGKIARSGRVRLLRDSVQVFDGKMSGLKRFKDDVREVAQGLECGIVLDGYNDVKVADVIEAYEIQEVARTLEPTPQPGRGSSRPSATAAP